LHNWRVDDAVKEPVFEIIGLVADARTGDARAGRAGNLGALYGDGSAFRGILVRTAREPLTMMNAVDMKSGHGCQRGRDADRDARRLHQPVFVRVTAIWILLMTILARSAGLVTIGVYRRAGVHDGATNARDWDSNGAGSERVGCFSDW